MATILIVEDEKNLRMLYQEELEDRGHQVLCASDGVEGIRIAEKHQVDLVIMDISMPRMDDLEAMHKILSHDHDVPVIINSGYSEHKDRFMSWSAEAYIIKSADITPLMDAVDAALAKRG
ncbi:MAG: response regulator [Propionibacteriaceae bacterium]|nr:response regulator [Propionibacteriaceae bacterium]